MVPSHNGPKGAEIASFGLAILVFVLTPTQIGYQDIAALMAQQPAVAARWREHLIASPFGTIHAATFSMPRPIGMSIPEPPMIRLASLGGSADIVGSIGTSPYSTRRDTSQIIFPSVNRTGKGDRLVPGEPAQQLPEPERIDDSAGKPAERPAPSILPSRPKTAETDHIDHSDTELPDAQSVVLAEIARETQRRTAPTAQQQIAAALQFEPFPEFDISLSLERDPKIVLDEPVDLADIDPAELIPNAPPSLDGLNAEVKDTRIFFGSDLFGSTPGGMKPWASGEAPVFQGDPDLKPGVTVAGKGEVNGESNGMRTPADRLSLLGPKRAKAEKCLANAVYFEARSEPVRGQIAVAQVVMNRAFSGFYPNDVCGVVYQNAHRHLACQFTFACDGIPDVVSDLESWERAKRIARETLDGKLWLPEIAKSTHYHASYVSPYWVRAMKKHAKIGLHHFYRPWKWGNGSDAPIWGSATYTADAAAKM